MEKEKRSGISIQTLAISAAAAVAAAVVVPMIWERGTLVATAMTPVIVALVSEALRHPAEKITSATSSVVRRPGPAGGPEAFDPLAGGERGPLPEPDSETGGPTRDHDPFGLRERAPIRRHWRLAVITGLVAFAVAVAALTLSELVFGGPATSESGRTTFFGGRDSDKQATPTPQASPEATPEEATPTPEEATPAPTVTPTPTPTPGAQEATPVPTVTP
jgi:hypothetical protein